MECSGGKRMITPDLVRTDSTYATKHFKGLACRSRRCSPQVTDRCDRLLKATALGVTALGFTSMFNLTEAEAQDMSNGADNFYKSEKATLEKVTFKSAYKTDVVGNLHV